MEGYNTVLEASQLIGKSPQWIRAGVKHEKIKALKVHSNLWLISDEEVDRLIKDPITISAKEMNN